MASREDRENQPQLDLERRQDDVLAQLDELNERIENLIELYTRLRSADQASQGPSHDGPDAAVSAPDDTRWEDDDLSKDSRAA